MTTRLLAPHELRLRIAPESLGFASTAELQDQPLPWIGQERARAAAAFGLAMEQPDYHLFVLGETGSGRSTLLRQAMQEAAAQRPVPPDLCYLHDFDAPEHPRALRLPAGQGRQLRQAMAELTKALQTEIPKRLAAADYKAEVERIERDWHAQEAQAFAALDAFAEARHFRLTREDGRMVFTLLGARGQPLTEEEAHALPRERRATIEAAEQELRAEIARFLDTMRPLEQARDAALVKLRRQTIAPVVERHLQNIRRDLKKQIKDAVKLGRWLDQVEREVLDQLDLFESPAVGAEPGSSEEERKAALEDLLAHCRVNLAVDNAERSGAPVIVEDNPQLRSLFGSVEYQAESEMLVADFSNIRAGSLLQAHGGFLLLHLRDLLGDEGLWERLRRFLRSSRLQIEEGGATVPGPLVAIALQPEPVDVEVKIVLIGSVEEYYALQEGDPETSRRFRVKVDFAERFAATPETYRASSIFVARSCQKHGLPHFGAPAVALLLEQSHREAEDQRYQSALFAHTEALVLESAALCRARGASLVSPPDVLAALQARTLRHNYPEQQMHESIADGERLISVQGTALGQVNALTQIDLGDYRFGFPVRITARTYAGHEGLLNIEREVDMSGPIHDKGVLILHSYLMALFSHMAPLALHASIVFEQEYGGIEGDSASCAELYAMLSALSGLPLRQGIAVTGALNQRGEVLPVGGINEKIEGWFRTCAHAGLDGTQGVLIPARNQRHLMLDQEALQAVERGLFHVHTVEHVSAGIALLTGVPSGMEPRVAPGDADSVLARAEQTLLAYRRACRQATAALRPRRGAAGLPVGGRGIEKSKQKMPKI